LIRVTCRKRSDAGCLNLEWFKGAVMDTVLVDLTSPNGTTGLAFVEKTDEPVPVTLEVNSPEETVPDRLYWMKSPLLTVLNVVVHFIGRKISGLYSAHLVMIMQN